MECLDDATVAVQLEPTLIQAITNGGFFNRERSTFFSLISSKGDCVCLRQVTAPQVIIVSGVSMLCGKKHKKMSISPQIPPPG